MKLLVQLLFLSISIILGNAQADPVLILSESRLNSNFTVNEGVPIEGLTVRTGPLALNPLANSGVDSANVVESVISNVQIGNPFTAPPTPFRSSRNDSTSLQGSPFEGAQGSYAIEVTTTANDVTGHVTNRAHNNVGNASLLFVDDPVNSSALSSFDSSRQFRVENTSNISVSFDIEGSFAANVSADVSVGNVGSARSSLGYSILFEQMAGATVNYNELVSTMFEEIEDSSAGASVTQSFTADDSGLLFDVSTISDAEEGGGPALSSLLVSYLFSIELEAGVSFSFTEAFNQRNEVAIRMQDPIPPVPLPASLVLLVTGLLGLWGAQRKTLT